MQSNRSTKGTSTIVDMKQFDRSLARNAEGNSHVAMNSGRDNGGPYETMPHWPFGNFVASPDVSALRSHRLQASAREAILESVLSAPEAAASQERNFLASRAFPSDEFLAEYEMAAERSHRILEAVRNVRDNLGSVGRTHS